jgi:hypothetical protein
MEELGDTSTVPLLLTRTSKICLAPRIDGLRCLGRYDGDARYSTSRVDEMRNCEVRLHIRIPAFPCIRVGVWYGDTGTPEQT